MAAEKIGNARCPLCNHKGARVSLSKSQLPVLTCNACHCQLFTRSDVSDQLVRALLVPAENVPEPGGVPGTETSPAPLAVASPPPAPARPRGLFGAWGAA